MNVVPVYLPPLRDRPEDIIPLAEYFLERFCLENHKTKKQLNQNSKKKLMNYPWPGNIRELANILERTVVMDFDNNIDPEHLLIETVSAKKIPAECTLKGNEKDLPIGISLEALEKQFIEQTLRSQNQNRTKTAEVLGISIRTLRNKLHEYRMAEDESEKEKEA
jgi:two-component system response regulator AtoC